MCTAQNFPSSTLIAFLECLNEKHPKELEKVLIAAKLTKQKLNTDVLSMALKYHSFNDPYVSIFYDFYANDIDAFEEFKNKINLMELI